MNKKKYSHENSVVEYPDEVTVGLGFVDLTFEERDYLIEESTDTLIISMAKHLAMCFTLSILMIVCIKCFGVQDKAIFVVLFTFIGCFLILLRNTLHIYSLELDVINNDTMHYAVVTKVETLEKVKKGDLTYYKVVVKNESNDFSTTVYCTKDNFYKPDGSVISVYDRVFSWR